MIVIIDCEYVFFLRYFLFLTLYSVHIQQVSIIAINMPALKRSFSENPPGTIAAALYYCCSATVLLRC